MLIPSKPAGVVLQLLACVLLALGCYTWTIEHPVAAILFMFIPGGIVLWCGGLA
jgi:uncharacterized membrane protein YphA (DoxX/SURF4 family)